MKRFVLFTLMAAILIAGCSKPSDKPMPISMDNLKEYSEKIGKLTQSIEAKPGDTLVDLGIGTYKKAMEKMGYSFDETYRYLIVFRQMNGITPASQLFWNVHEVIAKNPDESLQKGLISQRTWDFIKLERTSRVDLDDCLVLGISMVNKCAEISPRGHCTMENLLKVYRTTPEAKERVASPMEPAKWAGMDDGDLSMYGARAGCYDRMATLRGGNLIVDPNSGEGVDIFRLSMNSEQEFIVDPYRLEAIVAYEKKLKEEQDNFRK